MENENNATLIDTLTDSCSVLSATLQSSAFFVVPERL